MNIRIRRILVLMLALFGLVDTASACDPCALYNGATVQGVGENVVRLSVAEQYTSYTRSDDSEDFSLRDGERVRGYSTTQFSASWEFAERWSAQVVLPIITRSYDRFERYRAERESESGVGDVALVALAVPLQKRDPAGFSYVWSVFGGVELPTGDTGSLEQSHVELRSRPNFLPRHHSVGGGAGGRVLTLGSGSFDFPVGTALFLQKDRGIFLASAQYTFRTEGDYDYRFADDVVWTAGPGTYLALHDDYTIALRIAFSGEHKGHDTQDGRLVPGSEADSLYVGPELLGSVGGNSSGHLAFELPYSTDDRGTDVVPEWRLRAGVSIRF